MFMKVQWQQGIPHYTMYSIDKYTVTYTKDVSPSSAVIHIDGNYPCELLLDRGGEAFVMNEAGKTIDVIRP